MEYAIRLKGLTKSFQKEKVLKNITHDFEKGKIHGIMGFNGSGKTVMFKCICGFLQPESGTVLVGGKQIGKELDFPDSVGIIIENPGFFLDLSGFANLKRLASLKHRISDDDVRATMRALGLDPLSKKKVGQYSLGMRERLGIAQAIMEDPELLILDEPFNGLDKHGVSQMHELILAQKKKGKTILLSSHSLCDTICEMDAGVLTQIK